MNTTTHANTPGMPRKKRRGSGLSTALLAGLATLALSSAPLCAQVLLDDDFSSGTRTNQNLPDSAYWYAGAGGVSLTVTNNTLKLLTDGTQRQTVVYFTDSGTQTLGIGDSLSVSFSLTPSGYETTSDLRFGLFDSGGSRISADNQGNAPANGVYADYTGYALISTLDGSSSTASKLYARNKTNNSLMTPSAYTTLSGSTWGLGLTNGETYNFTLTITADSASSTSLNILVKDSTNSTLINFSTTDTVNLFNSFDTFALLGGTAGAANPTNSLGASLFLDNVLVTHTPYTPVPEANAMGMALPGTLALGLAFFLGRRRRKHPARG